MVDKALSRNDKELIDALIFGFANMIDWLEKLQPEKRAQKYLGAHRTSKKSLVRTSIRKMAAEGKLSEAKRLRDVQRMLPPKLQNTYYTDVSDDMLRTSRAEILTRSTNKQDRKRKSPGRPREQGSDADDNEGRVSRYKLKPQLERIRQEILNRPDLQKALNKQIIESQLLLLYVKYMEELYLHLARRDQKALWKNVIPFELESVVDPNSEAAAAEARAIKKMTNEEISAEAERRALVIVQKMHKDPKLFRIFLQIMPEIMEARALGLQRLKQASQNL